jgi:hypothetical protein
MPDPFTDQLVVVGMRQIVQRLAENLLSRPGPEQPNPLFVGKDDPALTIDQDGIRQDRQEPAIPVFALAQQRLGLFPLGHIARHTQDGRNGAVGRSQRHHMRIQPAVSPQETDHFKLQSSRFPPPGFADQLTVDRSKFVGDQAAGIPSDDVGTARRLDHGQTCSIDGPDRAIQIKQLHTFGLGLNNRP